MSDTYDLGKARPEMVPIIEQIKDAISKDEADLRSWNIAREKDKEVFDKLTPFARMKAISEGRGYIPNVKPPVRKWTRLLRRQLRYKLFRLREGKWQNDAELAAIKEWYELQFHGGWHWRDFTFKWDLSAADPLRIVTPIEWDGDVVAEKTGSSVGKFCDPSAFTNQEM